MLNLTTAATDHFITLALAKQQIGIEHDDDDDRINAYLSAIDDFIEAETNVCWREQEWLQTERFWLAKPSYLLRPLGYCDYTNPREIHKRSRRLAKTPVTAVSIQYYPADGSDLTDFTDFVWASDNYRAEVAFNTFPDLADRLDAVQFTLTCGADIIPPRLNQAALFLVAKWDNFREDEAPAALSTIGYGIKPILQSLRRGFIC
jgi:hypothetical protein